MGAGEEPKGQCASEKQLDSRRRHSKQTGGGGGGGVQTVYGMDTGIKANNRDRWGLGKNLKDSAHVRNSWTVGGDTADWQAGSMETGMHIQATDRARKERGGRQKLRDKLTLNRQTE